MQLKVVHQGFNSDLSKLNLIFEIKEKYIKK